MTLGEARDIALIILIVPALICSMVPAAIVFWMLWVTRRARAGLTRPMHQAHDMARRTRDGVDRASRALAGPVFFGESQSAKWRARWRALRAQRALNQER
ncbi:MAG TPA: hypothetical protein VFL17_08805 [Anaerolineae bacterium]|nr:hypothetical protein [Anaerolineae bacterium]